MQEITAKFTNHLKEALARSLAFVVESQQNTVNPIHLLWALSLQSESIAAKILKNEGITQNKLEGYIANQEMKAQRPLSIPNLAEETKVIIEKAVITANMYSHTYISTEHLLSGLLQVQSEEIMRFFSQQKVDTDNVQVKVKQTLSMTVQIPMKQDQEEFPIDNDDAEEPERALEYFAQELTDAHYVKNGTPIIGRGSEIDRLCTILGRKTKNNPILVGDPGVGKSAIVEGLAQRIAQGKIKTLQGHSVHALSLSSLLAGTMYRGSFEARMQQLIDELKEDPKTILFIDEIHTIVGSGSNNGSLDTANILKPALAKGEIRCIGATTFEEYKKWIESDGALERRFQKIQVEEPSIDDTRQILQGVRKSYGKHHDVHFPDNVIESILELSATHFPDKNFPDKAVDVMDEIGAYAAQQTKSIKRISNKLVIEALSCMTGLPESTLKQKKTKKLQELAKNLSNELFGQNHNVEKVTQTLQRSHIGLGEPHKPLASFLFVGPSGVGKTELAKQIAKHYFSGPKPLLRLDMSEYKEAFNASKLLGSPAGYVGYKDTNVLADHIRKYPHSVILFDEIEKAHPDIHNLLLQILEEGSIRDASGRELSFAHSIIILTSNAGHEMFARGTVGFGSNDSIHKIEIRSKLEEFLRPELLNRLDNICAFDSLESKTLQMIARQQLNKLSDKLTRKNIDCSFAASTVETIVSQSSKQHGARGIHQYIAQNIEPLIVQRLLEKSKTKNLQIKPKNSNTFMITN
ncbi:ATP-dependent Clp protease ATP-binding subunit [Candidatus Uhrbacteria bacterium]|jgi:ATP-dependent Clp protease ATP-binding subunit ClpC|nr:ATP-dependent Clp protease ATP-binding subunit [Candidatus Uhrbacteria bacterium]MBT7717508.1 ATP-dependent Clp protease ATP-binding subunit [Candidatus Uhrbacteria bacterium]